MRHLDLFSGIGGFALAASWVWPEHEIVSFCEQDKFCQKILKKHWPNVPINSDIHTLKGSEFGSIDVISGGFPCQPYSNAGKKLGKEDDRALWPEMHRVIEEAKPRWVLGENVTGIIHMELDEVLADLESLGYQTQAFVIPACAVNAPHRRDRVWIVAHSESVRSQGMRFKEDGGRYSEANGASYKSSGANPDGRSWPDTDTNSPRCKKYNIAAVPEGPGLNTGIPLDAWANWPTQSPVLRGDDGVSVGLDISASSRIKALGNAIVPQVAAAIFTAIKDADK